MHWYAVYTQPNHEYKVNDRLIKKKIETFLPLIERWSQRKDRRKRIQLPLFPSYLFVRSPMDPSSQLKILKTEGVVRIIESDGKPVAIPEVQIVGIQTLVRNGVTITPCAYLREGMRVRVANGPLRGIEGILLKTQSQKHRLVLSVDILKQSVSVEIDEIDVEPLTL